MEPNCGRFDGTSKRSCGGLNVTGRPLAARLSNLWAGGGIKTGGVDWYTDSMVKSRIKDVTPGDFLATDLPPPAH